MTRELLNKLPQKVRDEIERLRGEYKKGVDADDPRYWITRRENVRFVVRGYLTGLRDAGLITERERQILTVYTTV